MSEPSHESVKRFVLEHQDPFVTTTDVSEEFPGVSRRTITERLNDLARRGDIKKRQIGANGLVWYTND